MLLLNEIITLLEETLKPARFKDYCPNGLQVEGAAEVKKIVTGVTACQELIDAAIERDAQLILVHHGYFWKGEPSPIVGIKKRRLKSLLINDMSLVAYHLPLDVHPEYGNNVQLAKRLGMVVESGLEQGNPDSVGLCGRLEQPMPAAEFADHIESVLGQRPLHIGRSDRLVETIAWCTGAAQGYIDKVIGLRVDAYLTGEVSEPTVHVARESGIEFFSAGHHATERYGVQALGEYIANQVPVEVEFVDIPNPV